MHMFLALLDSLRALKIVMGLHVGLLGERCVLSACTDWLIAVSVNCRRHANFRVFNVCGIFLAGENYSRELERSFPYTLFDSHEKCESM